MKPQSKRPALTQFARIALLNVSLVVTTQTVAQSDQERMHRERDRLQQEQNNDYHYRILPQQQLKAAEQANRLSGPPDWSPGEIRTPQNHGALAWYEKGANEYGYVFVSGFISQLSAAAAKKCREMAKPGRYRVRAATLEM